ncbi:MAG: hypothetical protein HYT28_02060 [Parcubacteria group bacterium]|nr:hypothetical protein [Parcubacteria group bacterium]
MSTLFWDIKSSRLDKHLFARMLTPDKCVVIKGRLSDRNDELSLITEAVKEL